MSEEKNNEIVETAANDESANVLQPVSNPKPLYIALAVIGVVIVGALGFWFFRNRDTGQIVQAPRTVTFGDNTGQSTSDTSGEQTVTIQPDQIEKIG